MDDKSIKYLSTNLFSDGLKAVVEWTGMEV